MWQLRRADSRDVDLIMPLETGTFGTDAWSRESIRSELANSQCYYLVAFPPDSPNDIAGYAGLFAPRGALQADVQTIAVAESARRRGLGRVLVLSLVAEARQRGVAEVFLEVRADNPGAQALYSSLGFVEIAVRAGYYQPDDVDAIVMRLILGPPKVSLP